MCIFCKIINNEIPSKKVYEDEDVLAILDISQANYGHTLVMPKKHYENILDIEKDTYLKVMDVARRVAKKQKESLKCQGINLLNNCGEAAGQSVMHFHVHLIPRNENDDVKMSFVNNMDKFNLDEVLEKIKL